MTQIGQTLMPPVLYPFLLKLFVDGGYQGPQLQAGVREALAQVEVEIVKRSDQVRELLSCPGGGSWKDPSPG